MRLVADGDARAHRAFEPLLRGALGIGRTEMSTLLITASASVRASQSGLPVSRAIRSAKGSSLPRTTLTKRRRVSTRLVNGRAAQPAQAARAAATSASTSPVSPVQSVSPVAGSVEVRAAIGRSLPARARIFQAFADSAAPIRRIAAILASSGAPVVVSVDRGPDRLDLVDMHRAGLGIGPIRMIARAGHRRLARRSERTASNSAPYKEAPYKGRRVRASGGRRPPRQSK